MRDAGLLDADRDWLACGDDISRQTRTFRCLHRCPASILSDSHDKDDYAHGLILVTKSETVQDAPCRQANKLARTRSTRR